jgi:hypothetical protein
MTARSKALPYGPAVLIAFSALIALIALMMVALLGFEWAQRQTVKEQGRQQIDFIVAPTHLLDREFLRFTNSLEGFLEARVSHPEDELRARLEIFWSKVEVIRESPGAALMLENAQVGQAINQLVSFGQRAERALSGPQPDLPELKLLLNDMQAFTPESLAMANNTYIVGAKLVETQTLDSRS